MKKKKARGAPIDDARINSWLARFDGYRFAVTDERIRAWLGNFRDDTYLGAKVLDTVKYIKSEDMENALRDLVGRLPGWHKDETRRSGQWRFVAFSSSAGESGDTVIHKSRTALGLTGAQYNDLFAHKADLLRARLGTNDSVVFFDDFAGTGQQACDAWLTFTELLPENPNTYLILVAAGAQAILRIRQETGLNVRAHYILGPADDIFSKKCPHFSQPEKSRLTQYCKKADSRYPQGYGDCGFLIVLAHKTPNNSIPILHANHARWRGLFPRH